MSAPLRLPSNRSFGTVFTVFFAFIGAWSWWRGGDAYLWLSGLSVATLLVTLVAPGLLAPFNKLWMTLGEYLHRIVSPVVLGAMYFGILAPIAVAMRLAGRDALKLRFDADAQSYWVNRDPPGPNPESLRNQF